MLSRALSKSEYCHDLGMRCGDHTWTVHRANVCSRSEELNELHNANSILHHILPLPNHILSSTGTTISKIILTDDDPELDPTIFPHLYTQTYPKLSFFEAIYIKHAPIDSVTYATSSSSWERSLREWLRSSIQTAWFLMHALWSEKGGYLVFRLAARNEWCSLWYRGGIILRRKSISEDV